MIIFRRAIGLVRQHLRAFVLINVAYFGLVCSGMAYGALDRDFHDRYMVESKKQAADTLPVVFDAYQGGHVAKAIGLTFVVNLVAGSIFYITLPSLIVPFVGLLLGAVRALLWGFIFSPSFSAFNGAVFLYGLLIGLLLFLEGEGYVLAMLGSYIQGKSFLFPHSCRREYALAGLQVRSDLLLATLCAGGRRAGRGRGLRSRDGHLHHAASTMITSSKATMKACRHFTGTAGRPIRRPGPASRRFPVRWSRAT